MDKEIKKDEVCSAVESCSLLEAEKELSIESLKSHLREQRHDFFNLLQVIYGYTQLKKPEKVLKHISDYCRQMENIGKLYNSKCIKLADLLYTKDKEADSIDMNLEIYVDVSFDPVVRLLDNKAVLYVVDRLLSGFYYILDANRYKGANIMFKLIESNDSFSIEIHCKEISGGLLEPIDFTFPEKEMYWKKIESEITDFDLITRYCKDNCYEGKLLPQEATYILSIQKDIK